MDYATIFDLVKDHKHDIGFKASPCVSLRLKTGERFMLARVLETSDKHVIALAFSEEEQTDETPRLRLLAVDPSQICLIEAFEPEPRSKEATRRFGFAARKDTTRVDGRP